MRWILVVLGILVASVIVIVAVGAVLPRDHVASSSARISAQPVDVFRAITDVESFPSWRAVSKVEVLDSVGGHRRWREVSGFGPLTFEEVEARAPELLVSRIVDTDQGFGGTWTWEISPEDGGSLVRITERGYVSNPAFRFLSRFVFGYHGTQEEFLRALGRKFGGEITPVRG